jgi:cytochrome c oxidase subunit 2
MRCASVTTLSMSGLAALSGCSGVQSALETHGDNADAIARLIWIFTAVAAVVWVAVMVALAIALLRRRRIVSPDPLAPRNDAPAVPIVTGAAVLTTLVIAALTAFSYFTDKSLASIPTNDAVHIRVTGHQWWWEVRYESPQPSRTLIVANEIHVPVGRPVQLNLQSTDVIHSFWVPSLAGKEDLIPGHENLLAFTAERAGIYRGQCAEFCGLQHAHMGVVVVAEPEADFDKWLDAQLAPAADPTDDEAMRGRSAFLSAPCINCHSIRGTPAGGHVAPDLTHLASRLSLAADTLPMSRGNLAAWIADPQGIKPGANMPRTDLKPDDLNAIVAYLSALK